MLQKNVTENSFTPNPELEVFRQEKGKLVEPSNDDDYNTFAMPQEQQEVIYDNPKKIIKQYEQQIKELNQRYEELVTPYEVHSTVIIKGQEIPLTIKVDPYKRSAIVEFDQESVKKLSK